MDVPNFSLREIPFPMNIQSKITFQRPISVQPMRQETHLQEFRFPLGGHHNTVSNNSIARCFYSPRVIKRGFVGEGSVQVLSNLKFKSAEPFLFLPPPLCTSQWEPNLWSKILIKIIPVGLTLLPSEVDHAENCPVLCTTTLPPADTGQFHVSNRIHRFHVK